MSSVDVANLGVGLHDIMYYSYEKMNPSTFLGGHDDVIKWKHFPRYWLFVRGIHRSPIDSITRASDAEFWCFLWPLICAWTNGWVNNRDAGDLRRHRSHYDVTVMVMLCLQRVKRRHGCVRYWASRQGIPEGTGYPLHQVSNSPWWRHQIEHFPR